MPQASCSYSSEARPGDGIDHQQRRVVGAVEGFADFERMGDATGRGLVVHDAHGLDLVLAVGGKLRLDLLHVGAAPPVGRQKFDVELEFLGDAAPQHRELAGLGHQHLVARRQRIDDRGFPGAGSRRRIDDDRLLGAEDALATRQHGMTEFGEFGTAMIHGRHIHGPQHPVGHVGRSWNLKKMPSSVQRHLASFPGGISGFGRLEYHYSAGLSPARRAPSIPEKAGFYRFSYPAASGSCPAAMASPSSNGVSGCIRNAENRPSSSNPIDIQERQIQLPVTSIT